MALKPKNISSEPLPKKVGQPLASKLATKIVVPGLAESAPPGRM